MMASSSIEVTESATGEDNNNAPTPGLTGECHLDSPADHERLAANEHLSEIESTCTVLAACVDRDSLIECGPNVGGQILSAQNLLDTNQLDAANAQIANKSPSKSVCCIEIDLKPVESNRRSPLKLEDNSNHERKMLANYAPEDYRMGHNPEQVQNIGPSAAERRRNFSKAPPKLSFSSWRMREYFRSFKGHSQDTKNLYQFFKSARTELVACLLFALISSNSLIQCRTNLAHHSATVQLQSASASERMWSQLISGLIVCLLVASLTQVFGHVSGCHLIPSVSLALYIKGHIGRARLASYLAAQAGGALLGVGLLALLTSSQLPAPSSSPSASPFLSPDKFPIGNSASSSGQQGHINLSQPPPSARRRRKREPQEGPQWAESDLSDIQGSETILLSIMEQQQQQAKTGKTKRKEESNQQEDIKPQAGNSAIDQKEKTITLSEPIASTHLVAPSAQSPASYLAVPDGPIGIASGRGGELSSVANSNGGSSSGNGNNNAPNDELGVLAAAVLGEQKASAFDLPPAGPDPPNLAQTESFETISKNFSMSSPNRQLLSVTTKLKRAKRNKQKQHLAAGPSADPSNQTITITSNHGLRDGDNYGQPTISNMLAWALPEPIMSADSIRECSSAQPNKRLAFLNCLGLSNGSQMFVFQLLACSLVVLVYLVNVDPRRIDVGFKSLSIGFGHFVASALTINSGGFFGNPFHLLALTWFNSLPPEELSDDRHQLSGWRPEWWIYLVTPLIGGLFGAISHEYIDFSSLKNRDRPLHLCRSFHSVNSSSALATAAAAGAVVESNLSQSRDDLAKVELAGPQHLSRQQQQSQQQQQRRPQRRMSDCSSVATVSSNSLSTNLDPAGGQQPHLELVRVRKLETPSSYARQLSREHQRLRKEQKAPECGVASRRASDFDANFLISSSSYSSSSSPPPPPQTSILSGRQQVSRSAANSNGLACCSRGPSQMMISTSVM